MKDIRVLIADDEALVRRALSVFVSGAGITVVGEAADGHEAVSMAAALSPDVILMDLQMPRMNGVEAIRKITAEPNGARVLAVTTFATQRHVVPAIRAGASGYLVKDTEPEDIVHAIHEVHAGHFVLSPRLTKELVLAVRADPSAPIELTADALTPRELSIVQLIAQGMSNAEIAQALHLSEPTIKTNLTRVMGKWGVRDRVQVLIYAIVNDLVSLKGKPDPDIS